jgi:hypothetical protein
MTTLHAIVAADGRIVAAHSIASLAWCAAGFGGASQVATALAAGWRREEVRVERLAEPQPCTTENNDSRTPA